MNISHPKLQIYPRPLREEPPCALKPVADYLGNSPHHTLVDSLKKCYEKCDGNDKACPRFDGASPIQPFDGPVGQYDVGLRRKLRDLVGNLITLVTTWDPKK